MKPLSASHRHFAATEKGEPRPLVLFGLGVLFRDCYRQLVLALGREPDFLCDNAPTKWGTLINGRKCLSPAELAMLGDEAAVVITVKDYESVRRQLAQLGLTRVYVACFDRGYDLVAALKEVSTNTGTFPAGQDSIQAAGRWALVTGASRGIGRQIALAMAARGANIIAHSRSLSHMERLLGECAALGVQIAAVAADLSSTDELEGMLDQLERDCPPPDFVFNNAAISLPCGDAPLRIAASDYLSHFQVNTAAPIQICYRFLPGMIQRRFGRIVNVTSTIQRRPLEMPYACSKAALDKFVHDISPDLQGTGVMISSVCPGFVRSDMGGPNAPNSVESVIPGVLLGALLADDVNGRCFIAQDYAGLSLEAALQRARFYYGQKD